MSIIGQAARDGFKDLVLRIIGRRIQEELSRLKKEIEELDTA